jgi:hypothetical protein
MGAALPKRAGFCGHNPLDAGCGRSHGLILPALNPRPWPSHISPELKKIVAYNRFKVKQTNPLPLPSGRTLIFERNESDTEGSFVCSACRKDFLTSDPAEGMAQFKLHKCESRRGRADG